MIVVCPGCHKKSILKKSTGLCPRCSKGSTPAIVTPIVTTAPSVHHQPKRRKKSKVPLIVGGRIAR
jgi:hypothetical protein